MDGGTKKILIVAMAIVLIVSSLAILAAVRKELSQENPSTVIQNSLKVKNPMQILDPNGNEQPDYVEGNVNVSASEADSLIYANHNSAPEPLEVAKQNEVSVPNASKDSLKTGALGALHPTGNKHGNMSLINPEPLINKTKIRNAFPGYSGIHINLKKHQVYINAERFINRAKYGIPEPDMQWIKLNKRIAKNIFPGLNFGPGGFNSTNFNFTSVTHVVSVDKNHDGHPEYFKEVSYSNLTQDLNGNGKPDVLIIRYHELFYYDNNSDGNPNFQKWITVFAYLVDKNEDGYFEKKIVMATGGYFYDNSSNGHPNFFKAYAIANQTVDMNENHNYEFHLVMLGSVVKYDNSSTGTWNFIKAFFGVRALANGNNDGYPRYDAASVTGYIMKDKNGDGHPEMEKFVHWRYLKVDKNSNGVDDSVKGMAAYAEYFDNNSNGYPEYSVIGVRGISYNGTNQNGKPENGVMSFAYCTVKDPKDNGHNKSVIFRMGIEKGIDRNANGTYQHAWKLYGAYSCYDNNSDGNPEFKNMVIAGWVIDGPKRGKMYNHAAILYSSYTMRDNNSDGHPNMIRTEMFYREVWNPKNTGVYQHERGIAEIGYKFDNNSNGVFEKGALKIFGYSAYRNGTTRNVTNITLVVVKGNFTNTDDSGRNEFENFTFLVIRKEAGNVTTPEHVKVWIVTHKQYLKFNETANQTWLYNVTFKGVYSYTMQNGTKKWYLTGILTTKIDYNLDGVWDYSHTTIIKKSGTN